MKTMKRIIALLFCLILAGVQFGSVADTGGVHVFYSTFNVTFHRNHLLSQYGVTVYFDGIEVKHLNQGDILTFGAYMTDDRTHELRFDPDKEGVPDRCWTISNLQHGSVLTCEIQAKNKQVKIRKHSLSLNGQVIINVRKICYFISA